jgi:hypothetical protein
MMELGWWAFLLVFALAAMCGEFTWKKLRKEPAVIHIRGGSFRYAGQPRFELSEADLAKMAPVLVAPAAAADHGSKRSKRKAAKAAKSDGSSGVDSSEGSSTGRKLGRRKKDES